MFRIHKARDEGARARALLACARALARPDAPRRDTRPRCGGLGNNNCSPPCGRGSFPPARHRSLRHWPSPATRPICPKRPSRTLQETSIYRGSQKRTEHTTTEQEQNPTEQI